MDHILCSRFRYRFPGCFVFLYDFKITGLRLIPDGRSHLQCPFAVAVHQSVFFIRIDVQYFRCRRHLSFWNGCLDQQIFAIWKCPDIQNSVFIGKLLLKTLHLTCLIIISCRFQGFHFLILKRIFIPILIDYFLDQDCIFQLCTALFQMSFFFQLFYTVHRESGTSHPFQIRLFIVSGQFKASKWLRFDAFFTEHFFFDHKNILSFIGTVHRINCGIGKVSFRSFDFFYIVRSKWQSCKTKSALCIRLFSHDFCILLIENLSIAICRCNRFFCIDAVHGSF